MNDKNKINRKTSKAKVINQSSEVTIDRVVIYTIWGILIGCVAISIASIIAGIVTVDHAVGANHPTSIEIPNLVTFETTHIGIAMTFVGILFAYVTITKCLKFLSEVTIAALPKEQITERVERIIDENKSSFWKDTFLPVLVIALILSFLLYLSPSF